MYINRIYYRRRRTGMSDNFKKNAKNRAFTVFTAHMDADGGEEDVMFAWHKDPLPVPLNNFRVRTDGVQENQVHSITLQSLEVPNLNFQPIPPTSKFYSIAT